MISRYNRPLYTWPKTWQLVRGSDLPDADSTILVSGGSLRVQSKQTGNRTVRLGASGAGDNEGLEIQKRIADGFTLTVLDDVTSTVLYTFPSTSSRASDFIFDTASGSWSAGGNVAIKLQDEQTQ